MGPLVGSRPPRPPDQGSRSASGWECMPTRSNRPDEPAYRATTQGLRAESDQPISTEGSDAIARRGDMPVRAPRAISAGEHAISDDLASLTTQLPRLYEPRLSKLGRAQPAARRFRPVRLTTSASERRRANGCAVRRAFRTWSAGSTDPLQGVTARRKRSRRCARPSKDRASLAITLPWSPEP